MILDWGKGLEWGGLGVSDACIVLKSPYGTRTALIIPKKIIILGSCLVTFVDRRWKQTILPRDGDRLHEN